MREIKCQTCGLDIPGEGKFLWPETYGHIDGNYYEYRCPLGHLLLLFVAEPRKPERPKGKYSRDDITIVSVKEITDDDEGFTD